MVMAPGGTVTWIAYWKYMRHVGMRWCIAVVSTNRNDFMWDITMNKQVK